MNVGRILISCLSGVLMALAFPRWNLWMCAWVGFIPFFWAIRGRSPRDAALLGWCAGTLHYGLILYWLVGTMEFYGGLPTVPALAALFLLILYLGAFWAVFGTLLSYIRSTLGLSSLLIAPPLWCGLETLRGILITGFPWALLGYSQWQQTTIIQLADITGILGLSFLLVWVNSVLWEFVEIRLNGDRERWRSLIISAGLTLFFVGATVLYGTWRIRQVMATSEMAPKVSIGIAQGSIDQSLKWDPAFQNMTLKIYGDQTRLLARQGAEIVVWPETATPFFFQKKGQLRDRVLDLAQEAKVEILFGSPAYGGSGATQTLFNRSYLIGQDRDIRGFYDKMHLVPFGEYVPWKRILFFIHKMVQGIGEFSRGQEARVLPSSSGASFGVMICFESIFPSISRAFVQHGADVLANLTNDAWFGQTAGPYQHLSMLTVRAVENRRWIVRAANTGISAIIDPCGRLVATIPLLERRTVIDNVSRLQINSLYTRYGKHFSQACSLWGGGLLVFSLGSTLSRRRRRHVFP